MSRTARRLAVVLATPALALVVLWALPRRLDLVVVNPTAAPAQVAVDGGEPLEVPAQGQRRLEGLRAGRVRLLARAGDVELASVAGDCPAGFLEPRRTWVWSVAPVGSWWVVSKGYGDQVQAAPAPEPWSPPGPVFALPAELMATVDEPLPESVKVKKGEQGALRRMLWSDAHLERVAPRRVDLVVDNATQARLRLEVDGVGQAVCEPWSALRVGDLRPGAARLRLVELGPEGQEGRVREASASFEAAPLAPRPLYVWNVDRLSRYWVVGRRYGPAPPGEGDAPPPLRPFEPTYAGDLFRIPEGFYPGLDEPLPDQWHRAGVLEAVWSQLHLRASGPAPSLGIPLPPAPR